MGLCYLAVAREQPAAAGLFRKNRARQWPFPNVDNPTPEPEAGGPTMASPRGSCRIVPNVARRDRRTSCARLVGITWAAKSWT